MDGRASSRWRHHGPWARTSISARILTASSIMTLLIITSIAPMTSIVRAGSNSGDIRSAIGLVNTTDIIDTITELQEFGSRSFLLNTSHEAANYIYDRFLELNLDAEMQEFMVGDVVSYNVIATKETTGLSQGVYLFGAHYDSENKLADSLNDTIALAAPGADDDASGVAVVIEIASILATMDLKNTIKFVAFGAEEYGYDHSGGLAGSEYFVEQEIGADTIFEDSAIIDMVGYRTSIENKATIITNAESHLSNAITDVVNDFALDMAIETIEDARVVYSDHASFWAAGYPSILITEEVGDYRITPVNPYYHTSEDTVDKLSEEQIGTVCQALLGGVIQLTVEDENSSSILLGIGIIVMMASVAVIIFAITMRHRK